MRASGRSRDDEELGREHERPTRRPGDEPLLERGEERSAAAPGPRSRRPAGSSSSSEAKSTQVARVLRGRSRAPPTRAAARPAPGAGRAAGVQRDRIVESRDSGRVVVRIQRKRSPGSSSDFSRALSASRPSRSARSDARDAPRALVGPAGREGERLADAVDPDLHALGLDRSGSPDGGPAPRGGSCRMRLRGRRRGRAAAPRGGATRARARASEGPVSSSAPGNRSGEPARRSRTSSVATVMRARTAPRGSARCSAKTAAASPRSGDDGDAPRLAARDREECRRARARGTRARRTRSGPRPASRRRARASPSRGSRS